MRRLAAFLTCVTVVGAGDRFVRCEAAHAQPIEQSFDAAAIDAERARLKDRLRAAIESFDAKLAVDSIETRDGWREYLNWDAWAQPLRESEAWRVDAMRRISKRFYAGQEGLEHPLIVELRQALADYLDWEEAVREANGDMAGEFRRRVAQLEHAAQAQPVDFAALEDAAWWLAATGQAPETLAALRVRFSSPAIVGLIHRDNIEAKLDRFESTTQEQRPTRNRIGNATVVGTASVNSHSRAELFNAPADARLRVFSRGNIYSPHNVSTSGRVRVSSRSTSQFTAYADIYWNGQRFVATTPQAVADLHSTIRSIDAPRLIRRAASRRVQGSRASAEAQAESLVERNVAASMSQQLDVAVDKLNEKSHRFLNFLARTGNTAVRWSTRVQPTAVQLGYLPPSPSGLGTEPHDPPPLEGDETLGLSFHDAALEGILRPQVAGAAWTDVNFSMLQRELTGGNSEEFMIGLDPQRWSVDWSWRSPVRIHFTPQCATVRFRFTRVEIDGAAYERPCEVRAELEVSATGEGHELRTRGAATVVALDPQQPLPPHFQAFLERKFRSMFSPKFYLDGLQFPAGGALDGMSGFRAIGARLEANWVHLRYSNRRPTATLVVREASK